jgi:hypothetical protein
MNTHTQTKGKLITLCKKCQVESVITVAYIVNPLEMAESGQRVLVMYTYVINVYI